VKKLSRVVAGILERRSFEENARLKNGALVVAQLNLTFSDKRHVRIDITEKRSLGGFCDVKKRHHGFSTSDNERKIVKL